jgi:hypothetical protein
LPHALLLLALSACEPEEPLVWTISDQALAGTVGGREWSLVTGDADAYNAPLDFAYLGILSAEEWTACGPERPGEPWVQVLLPRQVGEQDLTAALEVLFFAADGTPASTTAGRVRIDEAGPQFGVVRGGIVAEAGDENRIDGEFEIPVCR